MRLILSTALTLMVGNMFQQMYTIVDASVVGRGIGLKALAALGSADWFNWLFFSIVIGFAQGFSIPVAQAFGAKDYDELRRNVGNATSLGLLTAAAITAIARQTDLRGVSCFMMAFPSHRPAMYAVKKSAYASRLENEPHSRTECGSPASAVAITIGTSSCA